MSDESRRNDELVSAYLDDEATSAEVAEVEGDDVLLARVEQLRAVRDAVAAPVPPMSAERRDQMISAALAVADAGAVQRREAKIVPLHRPRPTLLAVAAATIVLAAVVGAGLIASRSGDDSAEMAADAPTEASPTAEESAAETDMAADTPREASPAADASAAGDADMAMAAPTTSASYEMAQEEPMADEAPMADEEMADEEMAEPESQMEAPAEATADGTGATADGTGATAGADDWDAADAERGTEEERRRADGSALQVVDLGTLEDIESLFDSVGARWSAALDDEAVTDPGACSAAVHEHVLGLSADPLLSFMATIGTADPLAIDAQLARRADGTAFITYAAASGCEIEIHEVGALDGP